jgi:hypothetical protein
MDDDLSTPTPEELRQALRDRVSELEKRISAAVTVAAEDGMVDGAHHKQWVIDQTLRVLLGNEYGAWVAKRNSNIDYDPWDVGIAP